MLSAHRRPPPPVAALGSNHLDSSQLLALPAISEYEGVKNTWKFWEPYSVSSLGTFKVTQFPGPAHSPALP